MKRDKYNVMQSSRSIENLIKEFFQYEDNFSAKNLCSDAYCKSGVDLSIAKRINT